MRECAMEDKGRSELYVEDEEEGAIIIPSIAKMVGKKTSSDARTCWKKLNSGLRCTTLGTRAKISLSSMALGISTPDVKSDGCCCCCC